MGLEVSGVVLSGELVTMGAPPMRDESKVGFVLQHLQSPPDHRHAEQARLRLHWAGLSWRVEPPLHIDSMPEVTGGGEQDTVVNDLAPHPFPHSAEHWDLSLGRG